MIDEELKRRRKEEEKRKAHLACFGFLHKPHTSPNGDVCGLGPQAARLQAPHRSVG